MEKEKKIDKFIDCYSVSRTLKFKAIPVGKTSEHIKLKRLLEEDEKRAEDYKKVKKLMDEYHKFFINDVLTNMQLKNLDEYFLLFFQSEKTELDSKRFDELSDLLRREISESFSKNKVFKYLFKKEFLDTLLPEFLEDENDKQLVKSFKGFVTAFQGFFENRKNIYSYEKKASSIAYRIIDENFPRFASNIVIYENLEDVFKDEDLKEIQRTIIGDKFDLTDLFKKNYFEYVMSQRGIDIYNTVIGGIVQSDGTKIKGLNEYINLYNQQNKSKFPRLKTLYKQVLSDREQMSFIDDGFKSDKDVIDNFVEFFDDEGRMMCTINDIKKLFSNLNNYDSNGIYIKNGLTITNISNDIYGNWSSIQKQWNVEYDSTHKKKMSSNEEKYEEKRKKEFKKIQSFSMEQISKLMNDENDIIKNVSDKVIILVDNIIKAWNEAADIFSPDFVLENKLQKNEKVTYFMKNLLDSVKVLEQYLKAFVGTEKEYNRDEFFYGEFLPLFDTLSNVDSIYNATRNYITRKPYSLDKYKLYFQNPQFMNGWDRNKESNYRATILKDDDSFYLAIMDKSDAKCLQSIKKAVDNENYQKLNYKLIPGPNKMLPKVFFSKKGMEFYKPSEQIIKIYNSGSFKKGKSFNVDDCHMLIDFYKDAIKRHPEWSEVYDFNFSETNQYADISAFYREVEEQGYNLSFESISKRDVLELVDCGKLYMFKIYNKDFSQKSHGIENLHTMYFKMLFDEKNLGTIRLSGGAEMFMRRASLDKADVTCHPANIPMKNKNPDNPKTTTTLPYNVYKDKRFTEDQFEIHIPIAINKVPKNMNLINHEVRRLLKYDDNPYIIGIDRGERNLLYIVVIDGKGNIIEQYSLNQIISENNGMKVKTDYHFLLDKKEKERLAARQNWTTIENIKELKEGYISQVVHKICKLVDKYDAVIALEDLNSGFKNSRVKVEKQVYQKFEKMLIEKLNYMVDKQADKYRKGGILKGYQLTNNFVNFKSMGTQNGFIFYIPAWLTSKIDPTTGFVNLLHPKYTNVEGAREFIKSFSQISFDYDMDMFMFDVDYRRFKRTEADYNKQWKIYSNGSRIHTFRNPEKNNEFDFKEVVLTSEFKRLFEEYNITISEDDMREEIAGINDKKFYTELLALISLMLQMRNSISGCIDVDYLISPVLNDFGEFYDSRKYCNMQEAPLPKDADANGAYNIARKVLWVIHEFKNADDAALDKTSIAISNKDWLKFAQTNGNQ